MTDVTFFTFEQATALWQDYQRRRGIPASGLQPSLPRPLGTEPAIQFILGESMATAGNPRTLWTTARAYVYGTDEDGDLIYANRQVIITNRFTGVSGDAGQYGTAIMAGSRWLAQTLDCDVDATWTAPEALSIDADPGPGDA